MISKKYRHSLVTLKTHVLGDLPVVLTVGRLNGRTDGHTKCVLKCNFMLIIYENEIRFLNINYKCES